ncbi:MAG: L,D-transpeptidase family protein [Pseudomonadota bacterium]
MKRPLLVSLTAAVLCSATAFTPIAQAGGLLKPTANATQQQQLPVVLVGRNGDDDRKRRKRVQRPSTQPRVIFRNRTNSAVRKPAIKRVAPPKRKQPVIAKITGPQYYTYRADPVQTVSLNALVADTGTTAAISTSATPGGTNALPALPILSDDRFPEAVGLIPTKTISLDAGIAEAVKKHYAETQAFVWVRGMNPTADALKVVALLADADAHGLNADHYMVEAPTRGWSMDDPQARLEELIAFDVMLTAYATRYALDMKNGVVEPNRISGYHDFGKERLTADAAVAALAKADNAVAWLASVAPQQPEYKTLKTELAALRTSTEENIVIPEGTFLRPGQISVALPPVMKAMTRKVSAETRAKHMGVLDAYSGTTLYDGAIVEFVRDVQRDLNLKPDGIVGPMTLARLAVEPIEQRVDRVAMAMERLRWHPEQYGDRQVVINAPEYRVRYKENGETKLAMRAVVGKPANQTYFFHDQIETVVFNPYWGVPQSIIVNEMLPRLQRDPGYLDRSGYVVTTYGGKEIASSAVNWWKFSSSVPYNIRQRPGPKNALGELKILFPNEHAIYMHDTPAKQLFSREQRAYSHGCVRLEDPRAMAAAVLGKTRGYVESQLGGYEQAERLGDTVPVWVGYFTAWPDEDGKVQYHPDVYDRDTYLKRAMEAEASARAI